MDEHLGLAIAGLTSDARVLSNFMKQQCLSQRLTYDRAMPVETLVSLIGDKAQTNTQHYGKRPYGVGLLVAGVDEAGPHLFEFQPSGLTQEMVACAIGARSQMARTYLERNADAFADCARDELVRHGLRALKETLVQDRELTVENTSVGVVGLGGSASRSGSTIKGAPLEFFKVYDGAEVKDWINSVGDEAEAEADLGGSGARKVGEAAREEIWDLSGPAKQASPAQTNRPIGQGVISNALSIARDPALSNRMGASRGSLL